MQAVFLTLHVFDDDIVDVAETGAVFEHLPGRVRVEVDLDEVLVAHGEQTVARDVGEDVVVDCVLVEVVASMSSWVSKRNSSMVSLLSHRA